MKKVIVTGATGFVGKWVVKELLKHNIRVIAVVRKNSKNIDELTNLNIRIVECNINSYRNIPQLISDRDIDTVYHFAWQGVSNQDIKNSNIQLANISATLDIINAMKEMGISNFVGAGSLHEAEGYLEMSENKIINNLGYMYKAAKICTHWMAKALAGNLGIRFLWPIISNTYGEGENSGRLINMIIRKIYAEESPDLSAGDQNYDFVHISDVARAFYLIGEKGLDGSNYIIGSGNAKPLKDYLSEVGDIANKIKGGKTIPLGFGKIVSNVVFLPLDTFNIANLSQDTGFSPAIDFTEGITRTAEWIKLKG